MPSRQDRRIRIGRKMKKILLTVLSVLAAAVAFAQTGIRVEAPNVVAADEQFNVTIIIE